jgi:hypothetical protein
MNISASRDCDPPQSYNVAAERSHTNGQDGGAPGFALSYYCRIPPPCWPMSVGPKCQPLEKRECHYQRSSLKKKKWLDVSRYGLQKSTPKGTC